MRPPNSQYHEHQILVGTEADPTPVRNRPRTRPRPRRRYSTLRLHCRSPSGVQGFRVQGSPSSVHIIFNAESLHFYYHAYLCSKLLPTKLGQ